jgi:hypothetical protein
MKEKTYVFKVEERVITLNYVNAKTEEEARDKLDSGDTLEVEILETDRMDIELREVQK